MIVKDSVTGSYKFYKCQGHNTVGSRSATIPYVATDVKNGFETWVLDRYPFVGDTIKLYFKASILKYSNLTVMNRTHVAQVDPGWDMDRTNITYVSENHGIKIVVTISPISKFDQYEFVCFGYDAHGRKIEHSLGKLKLTVRDIVLPHFLTERKMVFFEDNSFAYDCEVGGLPIPDVYWYKDSRRFDQNNITEGYKITDDGQRLRIHATDSSFDGLYACTAENRGGSAFRRFNFTYEESHRPSPSMSMSWTTIVIIVCCAIIATIIIIVMCLFCIKKRKKSVKPPNNLEQILMKRRQETEGNPYATC
ncbi:vascular endothelial growth factor receptor 1-like [Ruditapes philippinarum]|uniref:vascular endothelial growth factor receptor 1-like n=1 Tax=Ruditapes philippinarum TaxID=129788 RepID=UPI00295BD115|nr:vascular endothelial growth factor receptor 1-like [Ruditapes philippinarum]